MKKSDLIFNRVLVELFAPPFLAVVWFAVASSGDTVLYKFLGFFPMLFVAYVFCAIPSLVYTFAMEVWFRTGVGPRLGCIATAGFSSLLGAGAGYSVAVMSSPLNSWMTSEYRYFSMVGAVVGLLVGFYVSKKQTSLPCSGPGR